MASDPPAFFHCLSLDLVIMCISPSNSPSHSEHYKMKANNSEISNTIKHIVLLKLPSFCLSLSLVWPTQLLSMHVRVHEHTHSGKFTARFLAALSTGKLHSIRKSIYIPVGCENEFPLESDEMTTQNQNNTYSRHLKRTRQEH